MGSLQSKMNALVNEATSQRISWGSVWQTMRGTCGYTDDELIAHASLLGAVIERPEDRTGFWGIKDCEVQTQNVGVLCWRWLMDNHKFVLEDEYNARIQQDQARSGKGDIEVHRG